MARTSEQLTPAEILAVSQMLPLDAGKYLTNDGTNVSWGAVPGGSFSWGAAANGASGTGVALSVDNSSAASTKGQTITVGNTQTNLIKGLQITLGTSNLQNTGIEIVGNSGFTINGNRGVYMDNWTGEAGLYISGASGGNNSQDRVLVNLVNQDNAGAGRHTGIRIQNNSTGFVAGSGDTGLFVLQSAAGGTASHIYGSDNVNTSTNGLSNITLSNTQSNASVAEKIDLGSSSQGHTGLQILAYGASTSQRGITINTSSTGTGIPVELITAGTDRTAIKLSAGFTSSTAPAGASTYVIIDIGGTAYKMLAQAVA